MQTPFCVTCHSRWKTQATRTSKACVCSLICVYACEAAGTSSWCLLDIYPSTSFSVVKRPLPFLLRLLMPLSLCSLSRLFSQQSHIPSSLTPIIAPEPSRVLFPFPSQLCPTFPASRSPPGLPPLHCYFSACRENPVLPSHSPALSAFAAVYEPDQENGVSASFPDGVARAGLFIQAFAHSHSINQQTYSQHLCVPGSQALCWVMGQML